MFDISNKNSSRIINLSGRPENIAIQEAKACETVKIRIQGRIENTLRSGAKKIARNSILSIARIVNDKSKMILENMDYTEKFSRKFTSQEIAQFAMLYPSGGKMTIATVQDYYSMFELSWRQAQKIIDKERAIFPNRNRREIE